MPPILLFLYLLRQGSKHTLLLDFTPYYLLLLIHYSLYCQRPEASWCGGIANSYVHLRNTEDDCCDMRSFSALSICRKGSERYCAYLSGSVPLMNNWPRPRPDIAICDCPSVHPPPVHLDVHFSGIATSQTFQAW